MVCGGFDAKNVFNVDLMESRSNTSGGGRVSAGESTTDCGLESGTRSSDGDGVAADAGIVECEGFSVSVGGVFSWLLLGGTELGSCEKEDGCCCAAGDWVST
jgi:hypothetical protein